MKFIKKLVDSVILRIMRFHDRKSRARCFEQLKKIEGEIVTLRKRSVLDGCRSMVPEGAATRGRLSVMGTDKSFIVYVIGSGQYTYTSEVQTIMEVFKSTLRFSTKTSIYDLEKSDG